MSQDVMRIATFNMENLDDHPGMPQLHERIPILAPQLQRLRADIICLQEINGQALGKKKRSLSALDQVLAQTPYADYHRAATTSNSKDGVRDRHNLVILSRFPIQRSSQIRHDLIKPPHYQTVTAKPLQPLAEPVVWERPALHAEVVIPNGQVLHVINAHLKAPRAAFIPGQKENASSWKNISGWAEGFFLASVKRAGQALEIRLLLEQIFNTHNDALIAVCGDFNANNYETPARILLGDEEDIGNAALKPRLLVALERSIPKSQRHSIIHGGRPVMVDHIFASQKLMGWYVGAEIHNEALNDELSTPALVHGAPESYHAPVIATFDFSRANTSPEQ